MNAYDLVMPYRDFFTQTPLPDKLRFGEPAIEMNRLQAVGIAGDLSNLVEQTKDMTPKELWRRAQLARENEFISQSFFYMSTAMLQGGKTMDDIVDKAQNYYAMTYNPYTLYSIDMGGRKDNSRCVTIFMDWDGTAQTGPGLRENTLEFLRGLKKKNQGQRIKYRVIVTSASMDELGDKIERVDKDHELIDLLDGIYSVPGIGTFHWIKKKGKQMTGKLYTDICSRLNIDYSSAVVLTDDWADRSVENSYAIVTLVTPPVMSADIWMNVIEYFQKRDGNCFRDFPKAAEIIKRNPTEFVSFSEPIMLSRRNVSRMYNLIIDQIEEEMKKNQGNSRKTHLKTGKTFLEKKVQNVREKPIDFSRDLGLLKDHYGRVYTIGNNLHLLRTPKLDNVFFIHPGETPTRVDEFPAKFKSAITAIQLLDY